MRSVRTLVFSLLVASSRYTAPAPVAQPEPAIPARGNRLEFAGIGGVAGGIIGAIAWNGTPHWERRDTAGRAAVVGTIVGAGIGLFVASFSAPSPGTTPDAAAVAPGIAVRSTMSVQPVLGRDAGAAIVRRRF